MYMCVYGKFIKETRDRQAERHSEAAIRPAAAVFERPSWDCLHESLSVDDVTHSKLEFGQPGMRFVGLGQETTFSSLSTFQSLPPPQFNTTQNKQAGPRNAPMIPQEQPGCSGNSHLWKRLHCQNTGLNGAREMGTDGYFRVGGQVTCQHLK